MKMTEIDKKTEYKKTERKEMIMSDIIKPTRFKPKLHYDDIEYYLHGFNEKCIENDKVYVLTEELTQSACPTYDDNIDKRWEYFCVPFERNRKTIVIPMWIMKYNEEFFIMLQSFGNFRVKKDNKDTEKFCRTEKFYRNVIAETLRFVPILKKDDRILQKIIPYDIRTGKIKGRHILDNLLSQERKKVILENYEIHVEKDLQITDISLNEYLNVAAICYKAAYNKEAESISNIDMYKRWADGRDGEMLSIKDWDSKKEFYEWHNSGRYMGGHPFEIVFSWHRHGIHLYPPNEQSPYYNIIVTNYAYARSFLEMVDALIKNDIPFSVGKLEDVLDFLAGDTYFTVNIMDEHHFRYILSREYKRKYFSHIEWDEIKVVKWVKQQNSDRL